MSFRQSRAAITRATVATLTLVVALITVGMTAPADGPFSITLQPVFLRLGVDLDLKLGSVHLHASWSALPSPAPAEQSEECGRPPSTQPPPC